MDREAYSALLDRAKHEFPAVLPAPLANGIFHALTVAWPHLSKTRIGRFLSRYCGSRPYKLAIAAGGPRHYLDGSADGEVTPEQQESARAQLAARQARNLAAFQANSEGHRQRRRECLEAAFRKGLAEATAKEEKPPAPSPAPRGAASAGTEAPLEPQRSARPVLELRSEVHGQNRQTREVQVVSRRKFARNNGRSAPRL